MNSFLHELQLKHEPEDEVHVFLCDFLHDFIGNDYKIHAFFKFWLVIIWWIIWPPIVAVLISLGYLFAIIAILPISIYLSI